LEEREWEREREVGLEKATWDSMEESV